MDGNNQKLRDQGTAVLAVWLDHYRPLFATSGCMSSRNSNGVVELGVLTIILKKDYLTRLSILADS